MIFFIHSAFNVCYGCLAVLEEWVNRGGESRENEYS